MKTYTCFIQCDAIEHIFISDIEINANNFRAQEIVDKLLPYGKNATNMNLLLFFFSHTLYNKTIALNKK